MTEQEKCVSAIEKIQAAMQTVCSPNLSEVSQTLLWDAIGILRKAPEPPEEAKQAFIEWFARNYPGPDTVIFDPRWHAPKIWNAAHAAGPVRGEIAPTVTTANSRNREQVVRGYTDRYLTHAHPIYIADIGKAVEHGYEAAVREFEKLVRAVRGRADHAEDCLDQNEEFGESETCECGAVTLQRILRDLT